MIEQIKQVREFMETCGQVVRHTPVSKLPPEEALLRIKLLQEELNELAEAVDVGFHTGGLATPGAPVRVLVPDALDALGDILYVLLGAAHTLGLADKLPAAFAEIHRSNMSKLGTDGKPIYSPAGKVLKGPNYTPPDIAKILAEPTTNVFN